MIKKVVLLFILVSLAFAQIGKYTHFVASGYNRAGYTIAKGFGSWNTNNNRYDNFPYATFGGGSVSDIAPAGKGFLVVGDFTSVNGYTANGIAYFDGTSWCGFPHLDLYTYTKPFPADTRFPRPASSTAQPGSATAIYQSGNTYYIFGGLNPNTGRPRFNQIGGSAITGVAGLARLNFDGNANFTLDNSLNYLTQGRGFPSNEFNGNGFPADSAPATTVGRTKLRVINAGNFLSFYVHPNVGSNSHIFRWRQNDGAWLRVTQGTGNAGFNVSGTPTTFVVTAQAIGGCLDFDADVTNNVVFCAGQFDNSLNQTQNVRYVNVACSGNAQTTGITWQIVANWANFNNFNQSGQSISAITVVNQNQLYVATSFNNRDSNDNLFGVNQYFIYSITQGTPSIIGGRFAKADGSAPNIRKLSFYNNKVYAFGDFSLIDYVFDQGNTWPRRYTRKISGAVSYDGTNWRDAYGGFTADSTSVNTLPLVAPVSGTDYVYFAGATAFYNIYSSGGFVAYNKDSKNWENMANQRFTLRNGANGNDGGIGAVHFIRKQRDQVTDAIVVAGSFDWYGSQYLASVAFFRTGNQQFEQLGQGVFLDEADSSFSGDQNYPIYKAGGVLDIEEIGNNFYVGGQFSKNINGKCLGNIAVVPYNGGTFDSLASGCNGIVYDLLGDGNTLYVGGDFDSCSGVAGTRRIAAWDTDKKTFKALSTGFADGRVYAMIRWNGKLYVGGSFATAPASYRNSGVTGLYRWDGDRWEPVYAKCQKDCDLGEFTFPFDAAEPLSRSVSQVRSLRRIGGNLYIQGQVGSSGNQQLIQYDGNFFRQYGAATGNAGCIKQGCLASNNSNIIGAGFSRAQGGDNYNNNYQQYSPEKKNWVDTFTGFDGTPTIVASANIVSLTIFSLFLVILMAL